MHIQPFPPNKFSKRQSKRQRGQPSCKRLSLVPAACAFALCTCTCTIQPTPDPAGIRLSASNGGTRAPVSQSADHSTSTHPSTIARSGSGTGLTDHRRSSTQIPFWGRIPWGRQENKNRQHELPGVSRLLLILSRRPISRTSTPRYNCIPIPISIPPHLVIDNQDATQHYYCCYYYHHQGPSKALHGASHAVHSFEHTLHVLA